ncbi:MAG: thiol oxidoreductase [Acidobacteria bacterium]|nr:thiol oxidoreductase [Acidobacteriota bacterium]
MRRMNGGAFAAALIALAATAPALAEDGFVPGIEVSVPKHMADGEEFEVPIQTLNAHGRDVFSAMWTIEEGGGRPQSKGTGAPLADPDSPLTFPRNFNRLSAPDANSCAGCHNLPRAGGGGDIVANVFVLGQRFDFATFDPTDLIPTRGAADEIGNVLTLEQLANSRATLGMFGSGYIEMLARQMTAELKEQVAAVGPGQTAQLVTKGVSFGTVRRGIDGSWDASGVTGLPPSSIASAGPDAAPSMIVKPFHQAGAVISLREFSNNAFNHHHGMQAEERFGDAVDADGDGFTNELTRADITAATVWQATLEVPGRVIPRYRPLEEAVLNGEAQFAAVGCASCHVPELPLDNWGWIYTEPNPYNPAGNLQVGDAPTLEVNLNSKVLPQPRLRAENGVTWVPAYTDLKLHDITSGPDDPNRETLNMQFPAGSQSFFSGNGSFLTKKLWGAANEPPYFHHGKFTTLRQAILAHAGEAQDSTDAFNALSAYDQGSIIEFLKTLQLLPRGTKALIVDGDNVAREWPPAWAQ